jgi:lysozyme
MTDYICKDAIDIIKHYESLHDGDLTKIGLQPKMCPAGIWTIGWGHALTDSKGNFLKGVGGQAQAYALAGTLTEAEAESLLNKDLVIFVNSVKSLIKVQVNAHQFGALVSFAYNVGAAALKSSTLLKKLNNNDFVGAANEFIKWNKSGGKILNGLTARRKSESELFLKPI